MDDRPGTSKKVRYGDTDFEQTLQDWYDDESGSESD